MKDGRAALLGAVRQEVLSGIRESGQFEWMRELLRLFRDVEITRNDHEEAATFFSLCQSKGIQGSHTDFLICAVAVRNGFSIYTLDGDFTQFAKVLPITLHSV